MTSPVGEKPMRKLVRSLPVEDTEHRIVFRLTEDGREPGLS